MILVKTAEAGSANRKVIISQAFSYYAGNGDWVQQRHVNPQYNHDGFIRDRRPLVHAIVRCFLPEGVDKLGFGHSDEASKKAWDTYHDAEKKFEEDSPLLAAMRSIITPEGGWHE